MDRRHFIQRTLAGAAGLAGLGSRARVGDADTRSGTAETAPRTRGPRRTTVRLAAIADLHQDIIHDAPARLDAFLASVREAREPLDAIVQMGDFAQVKVANQPLVDRFNAGHPRPIHVLGNHDIDGGCTFDDVVKAWAMPGRYATHHLGAVRLIVLDGNERPANHKAGYPAHIGAGQLAWLRDELAVREDTDGGLSPVPWPDGQSRAPAIVLIHQPIAGVWGIDNAPQVQRLLSAAGRRVLFVMNGHTHTDQVLRIGGVSYFHLNSASYHWVGEAGQHRSYDAAVHAKHPWIERTCPYRDPLFAHVTVHLEELPPDDPDVGLGAPNLPRGESQSSDKSRSTVNPIAVQRRLVGVEIIGRESVWVGPSPSQLGVDVDASLVDGEQVAPLVRSRLLRPHTQG